jgi:hypothetical protein
MKGKEENNYGPVARSTIESETFFSGTPRSFHDVAQPKLCMHF